MIFTSIPNSFATWSKPLIYTLNTESNEPQEICVEVLRESDKHILGTKRLIATSYVSFDIAPIIRRTIKPTLSSSISATRITDYNAAESILVRVGELTSQARTFIAAEVENPTPVTVLTEQIASRTLAPDECDMIGFVATMPGGYIKITTYGKENTTLSIPITMATQAIFTLVPATLGDCDQIEVAIGYSSTIFFHATYQIKRNLRGARRIGWLNSNHAPELYTFPMRKSILVKAVRKHMERVMGRGAGEVEADGELKLISAYEPMTQLNALAKIVGSREVWLMEGCRMRNVDLITDRVILTPSDKLGFVEIDIRAAQEGEEL